MFNLTRIIWLGIKITIYSIFGYCAILIALHDYVTLSKVSAYLNKYIKALPKEFYYYKNLDSYLNLVLSDKQTFLIEMFTKSGYIAISSICFFLFGGWSLFLKLTIYFNSRKHLGREQESKLFILEQLSEVIKSINKTYTAKLNISDFNVKLIDFKDPNMWVYPNKTIVITTGFINKYGADKNVVRGVLAHEVGHVINKDLLVNALSLSSNLVNMVLILGYSKVKNGVLTKVKDIFSVILGVTNAIKILMPIGFLFAGLYLSIVMTLLYIFIPLIFLMFAYVFFVTLIILPIDMSFSRSAEYKADRVAARSGFSKGLLDFLYNDLKTRPQSYGFSAWIKSTHPVSFKRIDRIEQAVTNNPTEPTNKSSVIGKETNSQNGIYPDLSNVLNRLELNKLSKT